MTFELLKPIRRKTLRIFLYLATYLVVPIIGMLIFFELFSLIKKVESNDTRAALAVLLIVCFAGLFLRAFTTSLKIIDKAVASGHIVIDDYSCKVVKGEEVLVILFSELEHIRFHISLGQRFTAKAYSLRFVFKEKESIEIPFVKSNSEHMDLIFYLKTNSFLKENQIEVW